jgi:hypothetical protein
MSCSVSFFGFLFLYFLTLCFWKKNKNRTKVANLRLIPRNLHQSQVDNHNTVMSHVKRLVESFKTLEIVKVFFLVFRRIQTPQFLG